MKFIFLVLLFISSLGFSQTETDDFDLSKKPIQKDTVVLLDSANVTNSIINVKELTKAPSFSKGREAFISYLQKNFLGLKAPSVYRIQKKSYKILVYFVVTKEGEIKDVKLSKRNKIELDPSTQEKIISTFDNMSKWNPGLLDGEPKNVLLTQSITIT